MISFIMGQKKSYPNPTDPMWNKFLISFPQLDPGLIFESGNHFNKTCLSKCSRLNDLKKQRIMPNFKATADK